MIASTIDERCHGAILTILSPVLCYVLDQIAAQPKPYVSIRELSSLTPWTEQAIRTMMAKGILRESEHFFHVGRKPTILPPERCSSSGLVHCGASLHPRPLRQLGSSVSPLVTLKS